MPRIINGTSHPDGSDGLVTATTSGRDPDQTARNNADPEIRQGEELTRIKSAGGYEKGLKHNEESAPRPKQGVNGQRKNDKDPKLASGRRAGAGWETSA